MPQESNRLKDSTVRSSCANRLSGRRLHLTRAAAVVVVLMSLVFMSIGFIQYWEFLQTGFTGAWCEECDYETGSLVLHVIPNSPADRAGIESGDSLVAVDGVPSVDIDPPPVIHDEPRVYGEPGTQVIMTIQRPGAEERDYSIRREQGWDDLATIGPSILGVSGPVSVRAAFIVDIIILLGFVGAGVFLIWRCSDDWLVILAGLVLIMAATYATRGHIYAPNTPIKSVFLSLVLTAFLGFVFVFPDGRLVPRWSPLVVAGYAVWLVVNLSVLRPLTGSFDPTRVVDLPFWAVAVGAQVYRYRRISTPEQRQQTKWVVMGLAIVVVQRFVFLIVGTVIPPLNLFDSPTVLSHLYWSLGDTASRVIMLVFPFTFILGMLRYRLWDVDFVVNRSVVYGSLSLILVAVFGGILFGGQKVFQAVTDLEQTPPMVVFAATLAAAGAFQPAREGLLRFVDRQLYGIGLDYRRAGRARPAFGRSPLEEHPGDKTILGRYIDPELLGRGGMAVVYKARHPTLNHLVAIKILPPHLIASESARKRFIREGQTIARLKHPNIVGIHDFGEWEGEPFMVMEYITGRNLGQVIAEEGPLSLERVRNIANGIASALDYAHTQGLIHRDVKPSNVMLEPAASADPFSQTERVVLMDFGIARLAASETLLTGSGVVGTFAYIAPEQIRAAQDIDGRADIYALGIMLYEMLTGELPFKATNPAALLISHLQHPVPDPCEVRSGLPPNACAAILKAAQKDPADRFTTAGELARALA